MPELVFTTEPLTVILPLLQQALRRGEVTLVVPCHPQNVGLYAGEGTVVGIYRPLSLWADLADALEAHLLLPEPVQVAVSEAETGSVLRLRLKPYAVTPAPDAAGYSSTEWLRVNKLEDPTFLLTFAEALRRVNPPVGGRVLALGVNTGRELEALAWVFPEHGLQIVGIDREAGALQRAQQSYPNATFYQADVNELPGQLGHFDLILALSLLQSPGIVQDVLIKKLRELLAPTGGLILGYPNARYRDGFLSYGARMKNFARPDFSLLMSDVTDARRRLQKYGYKVFVTGKYEVLVTAIPAHLPTPPV